MIAGLVSGVLVRDAEARTSASGKGFATATIRSGAGEDAQFVSVIAFGEAAERLLQLKKGDSASVSGRIEVRTWTSRDGETRTGLSVVASEIAAARPRPRKQEPQPRRRAPYASYRPAAPAASDNQPPLDDEIPF